MGGTSVEGCYCYRVFLLRLVELVLEGDDVPPLFLLPPICALEVLFPQTCAVTFPRNRQG